MTYPGPSIYHSEHMTLLHDAVVFKKMDVRVVERNIARGSLNPDELDKALKQLPDDAENGTWVNVETLSGEDEPKTAPATH